MRVQRRAQLPADPTARSLNNPDHRQPLRFAFYGRVSTEDNQDPQSSYDWQYKRAMSLVTQAGGMIVADFFDVDYCRALPWQRREEAAKLLEALRDPKRGFQDVVIGEPHRAFYGNQFGLTLPLFTHYGVRMWVPEIGGPIDPNNEAHELVMLVFGGMSKGERNRVKVRVRAAMSAQTEFEGRYLGGRPPYGYMLKDLGPHPNPTKAADGKRIHGLTPDPAAAPIVQRIYHDFLSGDGLLVIAENLTAARIPCPSAHDRARNPHRDGLAWSKSVIRVILTNPRYTGHQVWNKQRTDEVLLDVNDVALGNTSVMRWNTPDKWITSREMAHEPLIDQVTFQQAQELLKSRGKTRVGREHQTHRSVHAYQLKGLVRCGVCGRKMQGQHTHGTAYYRCRYPNEYAQTNNIIHPRNVYLREDQIIGPIDQWIAQVFTPQHLRQTIQNLLDQYQDQLNDSVPPPDPVRTALEEQIREHTKSLATYRRALESGVDPTTIGTWINDTTEQLNQAKQQLATQTTTQPRDTHASGPRSGPTRQQIEQLIGSMADTAALLDEAPADQKAQLYRALGLGLTFDPETKTVRADIRPVANRGVFDRVQGGTYIPIYSTLTQSRCACGKNSRLRLPRQASAPQEILGPLIRFPATVTLFGSLGCYLPTRVALIRTLQVTISARCHCSGDPDRAYSHDPESSSSTRTSDLMAYSANTALIAEKCQIIVSFPAWV